MDSKFALQGGAESWAAVNAHPHREHMALDNLARQGFTAYCPVVRRRCSHARRVEEVLRPLFPGYLFVRVSPERNCWRPILSTYGVRTLVRCGDQPGLIDPGLIEALKAREVEGVILRPAVAYQVGQQVRVNTAAFDGIVATILELDEKGRLIVLFDLLNRPVRVHVDAAQVMPL